MILSYQVYCCWNGAAIINAEAFYPPNELRFRRVYSRFAEKTDPVVVKFFQNYLFDGKLYTSCSGSEINNFCRDMYEVGLRKAIIVPSVKFAYDWPTYNRIRSEIAPFGKPISHEADIPIQYQGPPAAVVCNPMNSNGIRNPEGPAGLEITNFVEIKPETPVPSSSPTK
jgi:hypothetical protein